MSTAQDSSLRSQLGLAFHGASEKPKPKPRVPIPFSLRLTADERERLEDQAGSEPLGAYIRSRLFGEDSQPRRRTRRPIEDHQKLALVLAELGRSHLASNMNQLAKAANMGALPVSPAVAMDLQQACRDIHALREMLIAALGLKVEG